MLVSRQYSRLDEYRIGEMLAFLHSVGETQSELTHHEIGTIAMKHQRRGSWRLGPDLILSEAGSLLPTSQFGNSLSQRRAHS